MCEASNGIRVRNLAVIPVQLLSFLLSFSAFYVHALMRPRTLVFLPVRWWRFSLLFLFICGDIVLFGSSGRPYSAWRQQLKARLIFSYGISKQICESGTEIQKIKGVEPHMNRMSWKQHEESKTSDKKECKTKEGLYRAVGMREILLTMNSA